MPPFATDTVEASAGTMADNRKPHQVQAAAILCATVALVAAFGPVYLYHRERGAVAVWLGLAFSVFAAAMTGLLTRKVVQGRSTVYKPVLGGKRGSGIALTIYASTLVVHVALFHHDGAFWIILSFTLVWGMALFGWSIALIGALVGIYCERKYFS